MTLRADQELKLYILANGVSITPCAEETWLDRYGGPLTLSEYASTSGICFYTQSDVWINAPFVESFTKGTAAVFDFNGNDFVVTLEGACTPVIVIPVPRYHDRWWVDSRDGISYRYTNIGVTHTDRIRLSPIEGCHWRCTFCDLPYEFKYRTKPLDEMIRVIESAVVDMPAARHVLISGGTPAPEDEAWLDNIYAKVAAESPIPVDVMMPARSDFGYPAWLRSVGVNMISINLEISDPERARRITPNKARLFGRQHYLDYIEAAVKAFGVGFVQSLMVFGESVEPVESTLQGVEALALRGCVPVLSPFRPDPNTPLAKRGAAPPNVEEMRQVWERSLEICDRTGTGIKPGPRCIPCHHNTVTFPDGSDFYVPLGGDLTTRLT
jgi:hypothetical protein